MLNSGFWSADQEFTTAPINTGELLWCHPSLILFQGLIYTLLYWFRDLLRELDKKYEVLLIIFFLVFLLFLVSEGLLFVSFFWTSFHSLSSPTLGIWPKEGFYLPDPCELTFANTLLLSNAAISLGNAFISLEISSQFLIFFSLFSFTFKKWFVECWMMSRHGGAIRIPL